MGINYNNPNSNWYYGQRYEKMSENNLKGCFYTLVIALIVAACMILFSSCSSIKYVPVETVRTEYKNHTDTVKQIDSIFSEKETIIREADSALVASLGLQLKANERAILILKKELEKQVSKESEHITDTIIKTDSVQVPYPVEKQLTKWQKTKMEAGGIALAACMVFVILIIVGVILNTRKR